MSHFISSPKISLPWFSQPSPYDKSVFGWRYQKSIMMILRHRTAWWFVKMFLEKNCWNEPRHQSGLSRYVQTIFSLRPFKVFLSFKTREWIFEIEYHWLYQSIVVQGYMTHHGKSLPMTHSKLFWRALGATGDGQGSDLRPPIKY